MNNDSQKNILVVDLEMSGSTPGVHDIIQIGAMLVDEHFEEIASFDTLILPENETDFDPGSKKIHGISQFELNEAPSLEETLEELEYWLMEEGGYTSRQAMRGLKIAGQGINNDISFLKASYNTVNLSWPFAYQYLDLQDMMYLYSQILKANDKPVPERLNLNMIASFFDLQRDHDKHNALEDARLTALCFEALMKQIELIKL